jgi:molybdopterin synthase catalytic subunit
MTIDVRVGPEPLPLTPPPVPAADGAVVAFWGVVRGEEPRGSIAALEYEAYAPMAEVELRAIAAEAAARWPLGWVRIHHRVGRLAAGEAGVWIAVAAPRRAQAFAACRYVLEQLKRRAPIWKREIAADGAARWRGGRRLRARPDG